MTYEVKTTTLVASMITYMVLNAIRTQRTFCWAVIQGMSLGLADVITDTLGDVAEGARAAFTEAQFQALSAIADGIARDYVATLPTKDPKPSDIRLMDIFSAVSLYTLREAVEGVDLSDEDKNGLLEVLNDMTDTWVGDLADITTRAIEKPPESGFLLANMAANLAEAMEDHRRRGYPPIA